MNSKTAKTFEENLIQLINTCNLSIETAYYIVKNQALELELLYNNIIYSNESQTLEQSQEQSKTLIDIPLSTAEQNSEDIIEE